ncbi:myeloid leukemia factor isoform X2 [Cephus cinctus]|nr:myeloid leukemia factor isoform X2 [Cephus cinctus]XP_024946375.1 myeloid leukemia factor isoform X2 [Cephus cinctus]
MRSMRHMNNMMNSLFADPFGMMGGGAPALTNAPHRARHNDLQMMPFGFPQMPSFNMGQIFTDFDNMPSGGNCHSFTSRSFVSMTSGPDGRPQVYQESRSTRTAPGGVKETKKTVSDSRTGTKKMAIGHHIGERAHICEREQNVHSGTQEEHEEFINLEEEEAETFNREWENRTRREAGSIREVDYETHGTSHHRNRTENNQLALPAPTSSRHSNRSRWLPSPRRSIRALQSTSKSYGPSPSSRSAPVADVKATSSSTSTSSSSAVPTGTSTTSRKREHTPDIESNKKRHVESTKDD